WTLNRNNSFGLLVRSRGSPDLYQRLLGLPYRLPTGRMRGRIVSAEYNEAHLDWADDALKAALYDLAAAGFQVLPYSPDQIAIWSPSLAHLSEATAIAERAATHVLGGVPVRVVSQIIDQRNAVG